MPPGSLSLREQYAAFHHAPNRAVALAELLLYRLCAQATASAWQGRSTEAHSKRIQEEAVQPSFSIVIPARNAAPHLGNCLLGIAAQHHAGKLCEVIVVDDGSSDGTARVAESNGAQVITLPALGPAAARNAGMRAATGEIIVFLDSDCVPEPGCLASLLAPFVDETVAGVRGGYTTDQAGAVARFTQLEMEEKQERMAASAEVVFVDTVCAAYRGDAFLTIGGFDEGFRAPSVEDVDLSFRMASQGKHMVYAPGALVRHSHPQSLAKYLGRKFRFGFYRPRVYMRYPDRLGRDGYTPILTPAQIALSALMVGVGLAAPWSEPCRKGLFPVVLAFLASSLPLVRRARQDCPSLAPLVPSLLFARSLAQGLGLLAGVASLIFRVRETHTKRRAGLVD